MQKLNVDAEHRAVSRADAYAVLRAERCADSLAVIRADTRIKICADAETVADTGTESRAVDNFSSSTIAF